MYTLKELHIKTDYITLGQALKLFGAVSSGIEAKVRIQEGEVSVNGKIDIRRGKKLRDGDIFLLDHVSYIVYED